MCECSLAQKYVIAVHADTGVYGEQLLFLTSERSQFVATFQFMMKIILVGICFQEINSTIVKAWARRRKKRKNEMSIYFLCIDALR